MKEDTRCLGYRLQAPCNTYPGFAVYLGFCSSAEAGASLLRAAGALGSQLARQNGISSSRPQGKLLREQDTL